MNRLSRTLERHQFTIFALLMLGAGLTAAAWVAQPPKGEMHNLDFCLEEGRLAIGCETVAKNAAAQRIDQLLGE